MNTPNISPDSAAGLGERKFSRARSIASKVGVCAKTLHRWADAGLLHRHKINARVVLFDEAEVMAFIESSKVSTAA